MSEIRIQQASERNLRDLDLVLPCGRLTVITGVSGSGKSSLAFDTLYREAQRRFLELMPGYARAFASGMRRPRVGSISGLGPGVAIDQRVGAPQPRSTVGTLTEVWDLLRLAFARLGDAPANIPLSRGLFSFNGEGACPRCRGLGVEDALDLGALVADPAKSLRQGALRVTTPFRGGYLMYSQVTLDALDRLLRLHGGSVDTSWRELSDEVRRVVLYGSDRSTIPLGKHTLETRLRWNGITARPQPEGFYRGLVPVMEEILRGKRNDSILRFACSRPCGACDGTRLTEAARAVVLGGRGIAAYAELRPAELVAALETLVVARPAVLAPIRAEIRARCELMAELGLDHLSFTRSAPSLSQGEVRRLRLLSLALGELRDLLVVLDEPSAGLHPVEVAGLARVLRRMAARGQTVVVVDHDPRLAQAADHRVVLGPGAGPEGGRVVAQGRRVPAEPFPVLADSSPLAAKPTDRRCLPVLPLDLPGRHGLKACAPTLYRGGLHLVMGPSGAGKSTLLDLAAQALDGTFKRVVRVDASPIGRTPRSNPATYTGLMDLLRDAYAATAEAKRRGLTKSHFSFNTAGGRCDTCEGAGVQEVGMRHLGTVELVCEACSGTRFRPEVLEVRCEGATLAEVLEGTVGEARARFASHRRMLRLLEALTRLGLDYLSLGQSAMTLSGGEAQRVRLATELARADKEPALLVLDEPATGLHPKDAATLHRAFSGLADAGHTLLVASHDLGLLIRTDHVIELGADGTVAYEGAPAGLRSAPTATGRALRGEIPEVAFEAAIPVAAETPLRLTGVRTHTLKGIDVTIPVPGITAVTGPSGSGKSSLVFDTLLAESQARFADLLSPWARRLLPRRGAADLEGARDLRAAVAVPQAPARRNPRSTVGTASEVDELLRLVFSRSGGTGLPASAFSPNTHRGACAACRGLGFRPTVDPARLIAHPERPLDGGALAGTRYGAFLGEADGRHMATLRAAAEATGCRLNGAWRDLDEAARDLAWRGSGERPFEVAWAYRRGKREGVHRFTAPWEGLEALVLKEYERLHADPKGEELAALLVDDLCPDCRGERLATEARQARVGGLRLPELWARPLTSVLAWLEELENIEKLEAGEATRSVRQELSRRLRALVEAGLGYLGLGREMATLSGGEAQRLRLATVLCGGLTGVTYVLDEPTQGLHASDVARLAGVLRRVADAGNAVVVVEHEPHLVACADHVLELGPGAGPEGGELVASGSPRELAGRPGTYTAGLMAEDAPLARPERPCPPGLTVRGATLHNLRDVDVTFPAGAFTAVVGPSGSGKSTLLLEVLAPSFGGEPVGCREVVRHADFAEVIAAPQDALAVSAGSTVATLMEVAEPLRRAFAATPEAKRRKLAAKAFSTVTPGGRCAACQGRGVITVAMDLLPDVTVGCEVCEGRRFTREVLACTLEGLTITEALDMALRALPPLEPLAGVRRALEDVGLGYLTLGRAGATLSAGERQRLRLARLLGDPGAAPAVVLLDEPTRGLGPADVRTLCIALHRLADRGHLVAAVSHHPRLIAQADWIVELGPGGGDRGGQVCRAGRRRHLHS